MEQKNIWSFEEISSSHMNVLKIAALIPFENKTFNHYKTKLIGIFGNILLLMLNVSYAGYGYRMADRKAFEIEYVCEHVQINYIQISYALMYFKREKLLKLLEAVRDLWTLITPEESRIVRFYERKAYYFRVAVVFNAYMCLLLFMGPGHFGYLLPKTYSKNKTHQRQPPFKFAVDVKNEFEYALVLLFQDISINFGTLTLTVLVTIANFFILIPCGYLKVLQQRLLAITKVETLINDKSRNINIMTYNDMKINIKFHQQIMLYCKKLENYMSGVYFVTVFSTIYNVSFLAVTILEVVHDENSEDPYKYALVIALSLLQFFACQWAPDYLLDESIAVGQAAYFASFYHTILKKFDQRRQVDDALRFMIMRAQKPIQLTAGGILYLSMETFGNMMKSAFSVFTVFIQMK